MARRFVVSQPVVDLLSAPDLTLPSDYSHQDGRETQLLYGEPLILLQERGDWLQVGALDQFRFSQVDGWHPYPGWVHRSQVIEQESPLSTHVIHTPVPYSYATYLSAPHPGASPIPSTPSRAQIVSDARHFLGAPYLWGGRASPLPHTIASVDCSGLISLLYKGQGLLIPRNAHDQYLIAHPTDQLLPGDPLYLAKETRCSHVILKLDDQTFIEAPETGKCVRLLTLGEHIWLQDGKLHYFDRPYSFTPHPRTFF